MIVKNDVSFDKLRGGFYSPPRMVDVALERAFKGIGRRNEIRILEPSCGDGAFIDGINRFEKDFEINFCGIELVEREALKSRRKLSEYDFKGNILHSSFLRSDSVDGYYDVVIGNPPYLRYQFIDDSDKSFIDEIFNNFEIVSTKVANIWMPIVIYALSRLKLGGRFSMIIPDESMTGVSAKGFRMWLLKNFRDIEIDIFPVGSFAGVLQETLIISGSRGEGNSLVTFNEHDNKGSIRTWSHNISENNTWSRYLLSDAELDVYVGLSGLSKKLLDVAKFDVSIVTGANQYFSVDRKTVEAFELQPWARPLLPRLRLAAGAIYNEIDHANNIEEGEDSFILDFSMGHPDPTKFDKALQYIALGEEFLLHKRFKCSIREPWYRVPNMVSGQIMMSKRSHYSPRVVLNEINVLTTDTIYRGKMKNISGYTPEDFVASFHNSLTLLSCELEGRSFGGGVLEMVPSEVSRIVLPIISVSNEQVSAIDKIFRGKSENFEEVVLYTDKLVLESAGLCTKKDAEVIESALNKMRNRRMERN